jgi:hypothetical protein
LPSSAYLAVVIFELQGNKVRRTDSNHSLKLESGSEMNCRLCNLPKKFAKSHVIPEAFWRELRDAKDMPQIISGSAGSFPQRAPIGVYDQTILCEDCETRFNAMDGYGIDILLKKREKLFRVVSLGSAPVAWQSEAVDQHRLLVFLVGTLWRASVSTHSFYQRVDLGPLEPVARQVVIDQNATVPIVFSAVLSQWCAMNEHRSLSKGLMDPFKEKWAGATAYRFYFGEIIADIKVDQRPFPSGLQQYALNEHKTMTIIPRDFVKSKDFGALRHTVIKSHRNHEAATRHHIK